MTKDVLVERIEKAKNTIIKKEQLIEKRTKLIAKKEKELETLGFGGYTRKLILKSDRTSTNWNTAYWIICDIESNETSIKDAYKAIEETKVKIVKYENQLEVENQKENSINNLPEIFTDFMNNLINAWDEYDKARRDKIKADWEENLTGRELKVKYGSDYREKLLESDEHIHQENVKAAKNIILDLINRVSTKTGEIIDFGGLHLASNNQGFLILNGVVVGKNGTARVESILAGGYAIQRLHVRVLVK